MRWMGILVLFAAVAAADNDPAAQVRKLAAEGKRLEAARLAGAWVADAQKRGDLLEEEAAWKALRGVPLDETTYRDACAEVMKLLDPKRNGAYLSAHLVALEVLRAAIREGDDRHLADAEAILRAPRKDWGTCAAALSDLAAGVVAARKEAAADAPLRAAFEAALKNGWLDLATYAGTELACGEKKLGRESDALKRLDAALTANGDRSLLQLRNALAKKRIPESTIELPPGGVAAAGGAGGAGDAGGGPAQSPVGAAWKGHAATKPLITVRRGDKGFGIVPQFAGAAKAERAFATGVRHWAGSGITLSFCGTGVSLAMIDLTGRNGQPGESSQQGPWQLFYVLAPGETWSVTKKGVVSVTK
jgi:hypothetical protein